jgi:predicted enzyme related to lactoylglutathione lyase
MYIGVMKIIFAAVLCLLFSGFAYAVEPIKQVKKHMNPAVYFEIPVSDLDRAIRFYSEVFGYTFERQNIHGNEMAMFPFSQNGGGITGALAKGEIYVPTKSGIVIYFQTESIDETIKRAVANGAEVLFPKTSAGDFGFVAEFSDSEGNRIALNELPKN